MYSGLLIYNSGFNSPTLIGILCSEQVMESFELVVCTSISVSFTLPPPLVFT